MCKTQWVLCISRKTTYKSWVGLLKNGVPGYRIYQRSWWVRSRRRGGRSCTWAAPGCCSDQLSSHSSPEQSSCSALWWSRNHHKRALGAEQSLRSRTQPANQWWAWSNTFLLGLLQELTRSSDSGRLCEVLCYIIHYSVIQDDCILWEPDRWTAGTQLFLNQHILKILIVISTCHETNGSILKVASVKSPAVKQSHRSLTSEML